MITNIITKAPIYVWPLFAYIVFVGIKASKNVTVSKKQIMSFKKFMIVPVLFFIWASYSILGRSEIYQIPLLLTGMLAGAFIGYLMARAVPLRIDNARHFVEMPGSWSTLILALSIFSLKFFLGAVSSIHPELKGTPFLLTIELAATAISGIFVGRGIAYWLQYKAASEGNVN